MPKMLQYRGGSVIYFQGDGADKIYIVQQGSVRVSSQNIETGSDEHEILQPGEFFGVKSVLGRYNRENNAVAVQDSVIMAMTINEFEQFAMANTRIVMKMLKVFSHQLRRIHRQVTSLIVKEEQPSPEAGLFRMGEYYLKNKWYVQARYVFSRYLTYYPSGRKSREATEGLEIAENTLAAQSGIQTASLPSSGTMFVSAADGPKQADDEKSYQNALKLIAQKKYPQAYTVLQKIVKAGTNQEYAVKSAFDMGRCFFFMEKFNECIQYFTQVITKYPKHPEVGNALFFIGQSYEKLDRKVQAAAFYNKILTVVDSQEEDVQLRAKQALKALGV
jgi:TolA-binding protein